MPIVFVKPISEILSSTTHTSSYSSFAISYAQRGTKKYVCETYYVLEILVDDYGGDERALEALEDALKGYDIKHC